MNCFVRHSNKLKGMFKLVNARKKVLIGNSGETAKNKNEIIKEHLIFPSQEPSVSFSERCTLVQQPALQLKNPIFSAGLFITNQVF